MNENEILRNQLHESNKSFDYNNFFSYFGNNYHSASTLITSSQVVTVPNIDDYTGDHTPTMENIVQAIYDLPYKRKNVETFHTYELAMDQSIRFRLMNQFRSKIIWIIFPNQITQTQLHLLQAYQNTYGDIVQEFSIPYAESNASGEQIVGFRTQDGILVLCHSFEEAVKYAQTLPVLEKPYIEDKFIIGSIISQDKFTLYSPNPQISLKDYTQQAIDRGITTEECQLSDNITHSQQTNRNGVSINE